jgi:hypothetical protein
MAARVVLALVAIPPYTIHLTPIPDSPRLALASTVISPDFSSLSSAGFPRKAAEATPAEKASATTCVANEAGVPP